MIRQIGHRTFLKLTLGLLFLCIPFHGYTQSIAKNETDEFTGAKIVETDWESISRAGWTVNFRIRVVDKRVILDPPARASLP